MFAKTVFALALAAVTGVATSAAYADNDYRGGHSYRNEHHDGRNHHRDYRDYRHDRYDHERRVEYMPRSYVVTRPVYMPPPVLYTQPMSPSLNIVFPITLP